MSSEGFDKYRLFPVNPWGGPIGWSSGSRILSWSFWCLTLGLGGSLFGKVSLLGWEGVCSGLEGKVSLLGWEGVCSVRSHSWVGREFVRDLAGLSSVESEKV